MSKALDQVVVVDLTTTFWASLGAALLGDFGAEVIRIDEPPTEGRPREIASAERAPAEWNHDHELVNRNKMSLAVDLDGEGGREIVEKLLGKADVVMTDRPRAWLEGHGLDPDTVTAIKPDIVYARGTGFGPEGPDADLPPIDELAAAHTGMMPILGQPEQPPVYPGHGQIYTTVMLAFGVAGALYHRRQTGEGQVIDASLLAGNMYGASLDLQAFLAIGGERFLHPVSRLDAGNPMSGVTYPTSDDLWVTLTMPDTDRWWPLLAEIVDLDVDDERFNSHDKRCGEGRLELLEVLDQAFRKKPAAHWRETFSVRQMSADVIEDYNFPITDKQVCDARYILDLDDPSFGPLKSLGFPIFMTETPARMRRSAPRAGQNSAEILADMLEYSEHDIARLEQQGVIA